MKSGVVRLDLEWDDSIFRREEIPTQLPDTTHTGMQCLFSIFIRDLR
jgi:hypothetical protein